MKKIAIINQRYGDEVNGGSEYYTRILAEKMSEYYEIEILTTKAKSYADWANEFEAAEEIINGIMVKRFEVKQRRRVWIQKIVGKLITAFHINTETLGKIWIKAQGPVCPDMINYIRLNKDDYDAFIFVTYLYYPTVMGLPQVKEKAILIPTAHDEFCIYFKIFEKIFTLPKKIIYLTEEEKKFTQGQFHNDYIPSLVAAVGVDVPRDINAGRFREKYDIDGEYLIYVGRVDTSKGCVEMQEFFQKYVYNTQNNGIQLIILGQKFMEIVKHPQIKYLGFVSEEDKFDAISGSRALWLPSQFESLSIALLEAMSLGKPVIVNGKSEVLRGHCEKSGGGVWYEDYRQFAEGISVLFSNKYENMCDNARKYIENNYTWNIVIKKIQEFLCI